MGDFICFERHLEAPDWKRVVFRFALTSRKFQDMHVLADDLGWFCVEGADLMEQPDLPIHQQ